MADLSGAVAQAPAKVNERRRRVIVVGGSNMSKVGEVIKGRVRNGKQLTISKHPGQKIGAVSD